MQINRITLPNNGTKNRFEKQKPKNSSTQGTNPVATNPNTNSKKMDQTPFGFFLTGGVAIALYYAILVGAPTVYFATSYAIEKISESVDKKRLRRKEKLKAEILQDILKIESKNPQLSGKTVAKAWGKKLERAGIKPSEKGNEIGMNKVIGFDNMQYNLTKRVLMPLCDAMDGKNAHSSVPNGLCLFGPGGTGKTYMAEALGEHYQALGGNYEKISFTLNDEKDVEELNYRFEMAEENYKDSGKKVYTMILVDDMEKKLTPKTTAALIELTNNCKNKGVVFVSTSNDLSKISPYLLRDGRTDLRVPVGDIEDFDVADMISYNLKKHNMVHESIDYAVILEALKEKSVKYKPKELENALVEEYNDVKDYNGYLTTNNLKKALLGSKMTFNDIEAQLYSDNIEYAKKLGGVNEY